MDDPTYLTRRCVVGGIAGLGAAAMTGPAWAQAPDDVFERLIAILDRLDRDFDDRHHALRSHSMDVEGDQTVLTADVTLTWPPGERRRRFVARASDAEAALDRVAKELDRYFHQQVT